MANLLRTLEFLGLSLWLGSDVFLSFVVAPGAFRLLPSRDSAGAIVGFGLGRMHLIGVVCGIAILLARLVRTRAFASLAGPAALCLALMILLTVVSQQADSPLLAEFGRLHRVSASLEGAVLLAGFAALYLMVREFAAGK